MGTTIIIHHLLAVLKMPTKWAERIQRATTIQGKLTGNTTFPTGSWSVNVVTLVQLGLDIAAFIAAHNAVIARTGSVAARNAAYLVVKKDLEALKAMAQLKADSDVTNAETIITGAGYFVKVIKVKQKQINDAMNTQISGTVLLTSDTPGHHEWEQSKDMVTIIHLPATSTSHTLVPGLTPGDVWWFRNKRVNTKKNIYNFSPWIRLQVGAGGKLGGIPNTLGHSGSLPTA